MVRWCKAQNILGTQPFPGPVLSSGTWGGGSRGVWRLFFLFWGWIPQSSGTQGSCRMSGRMRMWSLLCHEAWGPCVTRAWHLSLPPLHPGPFPGTTGPPPPPPPQTPLTGDLQDKPGLPQPLSVPTQRLSHPILTCSGSQLPADIWKENEVISIIKTNCLTSVRLHCCAIMEWFRHFVRRRAGGEAVLPPWKCNHSSTKLFLERLGVVRAGCSHCLWEKRPKQKTLNFASLACSTLSIWCNSWSHWWSRRGHLVFTHWPAPKLPPQGGFFAFFLLLLLHVFTLYLCLFRFSGATEQTSLKPH